MLGALGGEITSGLLLIIFAGIRNIYFTDLAIEFYPLFLGELFLLVFV